MELVESLSSQKEDESWLPTLHPRRQGLRNMSLDAVDGARAVEPERVCLASCHCLVTEVAARFPPFLILGYILYKGAVRIKCMYSAAQCL